MLVGYYHIFVSPAKAQAALTLFYNENPPSDPTAPWWNDMEQVLNSPGGPLVGKRKRQSGQTHYTDETSTVYDNCYNYYNHYYYL